ncbi:MAG: hypothetical protein GY778_05520, partial [bacterium]|nr:hypothetical protein [bacterium]
LLFAGGVVFMYFVVLPIVLNFFVSFNQTFGMPGLDRTGMFGLLFDSVEETEATSGDSPTSMPTVPQVDRDPDDPPDGAFWFNRQERRFKFQTADGTFSLLPVADESTAAVRSDFGLHDYISLVLSLALAFGIAFELPVAVVFLALARIVPSRVMARSRRYVIMGIFVSTALLTPPDLISQILLAMPMIALFEVGLVAARLVERGRDPGKSDSLIG